MEDGYETNLNFFIGYIHFAVLNNFELAKKYFMDVIRQNTSLHHISKLKLATLFKDLASISVILGDCDQAVAFCHNSLDLLKEVAHTEMLTAENYKILGYAFTHKNDFIRAPDYLEKALVEIILVASEIRKELEAKIYTSLSILYSCTYMNGDKAIKGEQYALKALEILDGNRLFSKGNGKSGEIVSTYVEVARRILGDIYCRLGEYEKAAEYGYKETQYTVDNGLNNSPQFLLKIELDFCVAEVLIRRKQYAESEKKLTDSIVRSILIYLTCFYHAGVVQFKQGNEKEAIAHLCNFVKDMKPLCKSMLDSQVFTILESKGVFKDIELVGSHTSAVNP